MFVHNGERGHAVQSRVEGVHGVRREKLRGGGVDGGNSTESSNL